MKKIFLFVIGILGLGLGFLVSTQRLSAITSLTSSIVPLPTQTEEELIAPLPSPTPVAAISQPIQLSVDSIGVSAEVETVGMDQNGAMDVPKQDENVAWYQLGAKPGDKGSAVIAGHFDSKTGGPAVFFDLAQLKPGDEVKVVGEDGRELTFTVQQIEKYKDASFPIETVFGQNDARRLNLITCAGSFNKQTKNYSDRLVVYTVLKESII